jgi:hypothetical protein
MIRRPAPPVMLRATVVGLLSVATGLAAIGIWLTVDALSTADLLFGLAAVVYGLAALAFARLCRTVQRALWAWETAIASQDAAQALMREFAKLVEPPSTADPAGPLGHCHALSPTADETTDGWRGWCRCLNPATHTATLAGTPDGPQLQVPLCDGPHRFPEPGEAR